MELIGKYNLKADREQVWAALNDPTILQKCIPGCETLTKASDTNFSASVVAKVGPVKAKFSGEVELTELSPPSSYKISGEGKGGAAGFASGSADVKLEESDEGGTVLSYTVNAQVGGKLAQIGSRLIDSTAKKLSREFFDKFLPTLRLPCPSRQKKQHLSLLIYFHQKNHFDRCPQGSLFLHLWIYPD